MAFETEYTIAQRFIPAPSKRRSGLRVDPGVRFVVAHDTGNPGSSAAANVNYYSNSRNVDSASAHIFVDDNSIIECIPALTSDQPEKAWHVLYNVPTDNKLFGFNANDAAIGVEYCYGPKIDADEAYRRYVWVIAYTCFHFKLSPNKVVGHHFLDPQRKTDPISGLARSRRTYEQLLKDVVTKHASAVAESATLFVPDANAKPFLEGGGFVRVETSLNIRLKAPSRLAPVVRTAKPSEILAYSGLTNAGEAINGDTRWLRNADGDYFWSGATTPV